MKKNGLTGKSKNWVYRLNDTMGDTVAIRLDTQVSRVSA